MQSAPCGTRHLRGRVCVLCAVLLLAACGAPETADERPVVAVSVLPLAYFTTQIAGDRIRVVVMLPPAASPVTYEPNMAQLSAISRAALYIKVGHPHFPFETTWLDAAVAEADALPVVAIADSNSNSNADERGDPHVWLSPRHARAASARIESALAQILPDDRAALAANRRALDAEIDAVDRDLRTRLAPYRGGRFTVFHPAWGDLARDYGLEQVAIERDGKAPDAYALAETVARARADGVKVIFAQPHFDRTSAELIASEIGARVELIDPLAYDWPGNLRNVARLLPEGIVR